MDMDLAMKVAKALLEFEASLLPSVDAEHVRKTMAEFEVHLAQFKCVDEGRAAHDATEAVTRWMMDKPLVDTRALILCSQLRIRSAFALLARVAQTHPEALGIE